MFKPEKRLQSNIASIAREKVRHIAQTVRSTIWERPRLERGSAAATEPNYLNPASAILSRMPSAKPAKKLFLVDAMGFIFRAFFAPMERLRSPSGMPTKVPYLFVQMLRRLMKDFQPDYLAVAFDLPEPTFRDKLFAEYKATRPPMPDDLALLSVALASGGHGILRISFTASKSSGSLNDFTRSCS